MIECPVNHPALPALFDPMIPDHPALWAVLKGRHTGRAMVDNVEHPTHCVLRTDAALTYSSRQISQTFLHEAIPHFQKVGPIWLIWRPTLSPHNFAPQADEIVERLEFCDHVARKLGFRQEQAYQVLEYRHLI